MDYWEVIMYVEHVAVNGGDDGGLCQMGGFTTLEKAKECVYSHIKEYDIVKEFNKQDFVWEEDSCNSLITKEFKPDDRTTISYMISKKQLQ